MSMITQTDFDNRHGFGIDQLNGKALTVGSGFTGTGHLFYSGARKVGNMVITDMYVDLTGLNSSAAADIIGDDGVANCHFGQIKDNINGIPKFFRMECLEAPAGGEPDIDVYAAAEATGTEDTAITALTETAVLQAAADWTLGSVKYADVSAADLTDLYLYLVGSGAGTDATYTAGRFHMQFVASVS